MFVLMSFLILQAKDDSCYKVNNFRLITFQNNNNISALSEKT